MKLQCELCKEIVAADFTVAGDTIVVRCPACTQQFTVAATAATPREPATAARQDPAGPMTCPKCGDAQPEADACRSCGLLASRMAGFARDRDDPVPAEVRAAWQVVLDRWDDPAAHERFVEVAAATGGYPWAARRYRDALRQRPGDARASAQLARVARMAEATLRASATPKTSAPLPYRGVLYLLVAIVFLSAIGYALPLLLTNPAGPDPTTRPARPSRPAPPRKPRSGSAPTSRDPGWPGSR